MRRNRIFEDYFLSLRVLRASVVKLMLREPQVSYLTDFGLENDAIGVENTCFWNVY